MSSAAIQRVEIYAHLHTSYTNKGDKFVVSLGQDGYSGRHGSEDPIPVQRSAVERLGLPLKSPPVLEPNPDWKDRGNGTLHIPLLLVLVFFCDGSCRQFRTESLEYLMLPWHEADVAHYNPAFSLAVASLMPRNFLNRDYLLTGHPPMPEEQISDRQKIALALKNKEPRRVRPIGPMATAIENSDLETLQKLLALGNLPTQQLIDYARKYVLRHQIEREALVKIQAALTKRHREDWDRALRPWERLVRGAPAPPTLAERAARIVDLLEGKSCCAEGTRD
ncbi:MAG: hypothetical protein U0931_38215 [Vulcanimicrobiota bacterium]